MVRRSRGYTMIEVVIAMAIFGVFLLILVILTAEMRRYERKLPVNFMTHPQTGAVLARLRKDVLSATSPYYPSGYDTYRQGNKTLIIYTLLETGFNETVVWDFREEGIARRLSFNVGNMTSNWSARGVPSFVIDSFEMGTDDPVSVRVRAYDEGGNLAIDQVLQPRPHPEPPGSGG